MKFSSALQVLLDEDGALAQRAGWNGKGQFIYNVPGSQFQVSRAPLNVIFPEGTQINYRPHLDMRFADGRMGVWTAQAADVLADDWQIIAQDGLVLSGYGDDNQEIEIGTFANAVDMLLDGHRVTNEEWNGRDMWVCIANGTTTHTPDGKLTSWLMLRTPDGNHVPWVPSHGDMFSKGWRRAPDTEKLL